MCIRDRVTIKSGGNVGIGTTTPGYLLSLSVSNGADLHFSNSSSLSDGDYLARIYAADSSNNFFAGINMFYHDSNDGEIRFRVKTANTNTDVMTLVDGRVGINTTSPAKALQAESNSNEDKRSIRLAYDSSYYFDLKQKGAGGIQYNAHNATSGGHRFDIDGSEKLRIAYNGNVGIGTTSPAKALHVVSAANPVSYTHLTLPTKA